MTDTATEAWSSSKSAHRRIDALEQTLQQTNSLITDLKGGVDRLNESEIRRAEREKILEKVSTDQQRFWRWALPMVGTLIAALIGAMVWLLSRMPEQTQQYRAHPLQGVPSDSK